MSSYAYKHVFLYLYAKTKSIYFFIDPIQNHKYGKKFNQNFFVKKSLKFITCKILVVEHSAWRQMKENYQIYSSCRFCLRE